MAYKQEPCPLCGRNMTAIETYPGRGELYCGHCDLAIGGNDAKTPEELIALMDSSEHRRLKAKNAKLRELVHGLHMAYVGALNECESMDEGLIWDHCEMVDAELAKSHARFEADRHRFDVAMRELGIEVVG